jgi:hypothetical protein
MMKKSSIAIHLLCILLLSLYSHAQQQPVDTTSLNSAASAFLDDWAQGHIVSAAARLSIDAVNSTCTQQLLSAGANPLSAEQEANAFKQYLNRAYLGNLKARPSNDSASGTVGQNGGIVDVWVNPKAGGLPVQTQIGCNLTPCSDNAHTYTIQPGDQVIVRVTPTTLAVNPVAATLDFTPNTSSGPVIFTGVCTPRLGPNLKMYPVLGNSSKPTVLYGSGQRASVHSQLMGKPVTTAQYQWCDYPFGDLSFPDVWLGESATINGTLTNLYVKQQQLERAPGEWTPMGGLVEIWINKKSGGVPISTGISCQLPSVSSFATCSSAAGYPVEAGDRIIAIATPYSNELSALKATVDILPGSNPGTTIPLTGYCKSPGNAGGSSVLFGLGQRSTDDCWVAPAALSAPYTSISATLGEMIPSPGPINSGVLTNLAVKQELTTSGGGLGGTVSVWLNPKSGTPEKTSISCTLTPSTSNFAFCSSNQSIGAAPGDKVIVVADAPSGASAAPLSATLDFVYQTPTQTLSVSINDVSSGLGNVTSTPGGINCGAGGTSCTATFASGTVVTLTATGNSSYPISSSFQLWGAGGPCSGGNGNGICQVTMTSGIHVDAYFERCIRGGDLISCAIY